MTAMTVTFKNVGRLSNDHGEGNENVPSYQNECAFFVLTFSLLFQLSKSGKYG